MQCPKCKMNNRDGNQVCMYCGFNFGNTNVNQIIPNNNPQQYNLNSEVNNNTVVQNNIQNMNNSQKNESVDINPTETRSKILITLPAFGILLIYFYEIVALSASIYTMLKFYNTFHLNLMDIIKSETFLKSIGIDLLLIVSFILTILHKKFMGFAAILYSIVYVIYYIVISFKVYETIKFNSLILPLIICVFVTVCAVFYLSEEEPR